MNFKVGQKVVYPNHGIGVILEIAVREVSRDQTSQFYHLRLEATNSMVMIPITNAKEVGLRPPINHEECSRLMRSLSEDFDEPAADWKDRYKEFLEHMKTGDVFQIAQVLKTLVYLNVLKPLSFREKRLLEKARYLVASEIAEVTRKTVLQVDPKIDEALDEACNKRLARNGRTRPAVAAAAR
ncbi:MAG: CarD family transcriptional regulator [Acidobacteria bacterium]|nr:CarD family transcriptional regulator [Acidobacteriota bacterium]